jgi:hypothetical protein
LEDPPQRGMPLGPPPDSRSVAFAGAHGDRSLKVALAPALQRFCIVPVAVTYRGVVAGSVLRFPRHGLQLGIPRQADLGSRRQSFS